MRAAQRLTGWRRVLQAQAAEATAGAVPVIVRNTGGGGSRDVHLENFSVSNGGQELIEARRPLLALPFDLMSSLLWHGSTVPIRVMNSDTMREPASAGSLCGV
jgi:hypothetical protein